jgi:hypothetical protein
MSDTHGRPGCTLQARGQEVRVPLAPQPHTSRSKSVSAFCSRVGDFPLPFVGGVQIDQRAASGAVTHPRHQFAQIGPSGGGQVVSGMT